MTKRKDIDIVYTQHLASNLSELATVLGIPRKVLNEWRESWLSYPVTEEQFKTLVIIRNHVWGKENLLRVQISKKTKADAARLVRNAPLSRPVSFARDELLRHKLMGSRYYLTSKKLKETVRNYFPKGYVAVTSDVIKKMRRWVYDQVRNADSAQIELLRKSVGLVKNEDGKLVRKRRVKKKQVKVMDDFMYV